MVYLLDANVLITANSSYYPIEQVPEFWSWLQYQATLGRVKIPVEVMEEILAGRRNNDPLMDWISESDNSNVILLEEAVDLSLVQLVVSKGYADDLSDDEVEKLGRDPFLIAYGLSTPAERCIVTTEVSRPSALRQNRKVPDVCRFLGVNCCGPFALNRDLGFQTGWRNSADDTGSQAGRRKFFLSE